VCQASTVLIMLEIAASRITMQAAMQSTTLPKLLTITTRVAKLESAKVRVVSVPRQVSVNLDFVDKIIVSLLTAPKANFSGNANKVHNLVFAKTDTAQPSLLSPSLHGQFGFQALLALSSFCFSL